MAEFSDKLAALGFSSYGEYLESSHWKEFKQRYRTSGASMRCRVCGAGRIQLHHHTYIRLGQEAIGDVTPLCREHHQAVHEWLKTSGRIFVEFTHEALAALGANEPTRQPVRLGKKKLKKERRRQQRQATLLAKATSDVQLRELGRVALELACTQKRAKHKRRVIAGLLSRDDAKGLTHYIAWLRTEPRLRHALGPEAMGRQVAAMETERQHKKGHTFSITPRVTPAFQPNATATPNRDAAGQMQRLKKALAARKKGGPDSPG